ncbi:MAG: hypothetical protein E6J06_08820 [Chloroflexi bacterium]|nr:MAG: hypothetical protein E6J06_08820 [Chloroflexota bacterium]
MYDGFDSLPDDIQSRITSLIEPSDPEAWVRSPIQALDGRSFLEAINSDDGEKTVAHYFDSVETFERPTLQPGPENLRQIFHFDDADLDSNRAGLLSAAQRSRLWRQDVLKMLGAAVCLVAGVMFNVALLAGWMTAHGRGAALGVSLILVGLILAVWSAETWLDLMPGSVLTAEGYLRPTERIVSGRYGPSTIYCIEIGNQTFDVPMAAHDAIREGKRRLYYLHRTRTVLSVDPPEK